ncbi:MAG: glycosyltransferase family 2 protein [bacterium]
MEISIIINNYQTKGLLKQCLRGIFTFPPSVEFEVIVVDNNSNDGTVEMVRENFPQVKLIASLENLGHHRGNNLGIKSSNGKYILILNTDIAIVDNAIDKLYQFMQGHEQVALVGPRLRNPDNSIQLSCMRFPAPWVPLYRRTFLGNFSFAKKKLDQYLMTDFNHETTREVDWILGACEMVRRSAIDKVGLMDEYLFLYFGDVAWCKKFHDNGYGVYYFAGADIVHYHKRESAESGLFSRIFWIHIFDWLKYLKKYSKKNVVQKNT